MCLEMTKEEIEAFLEKMRAEAPKTLITAVPAKSPLWEWYAVDIARENKEDGCNVIWHTRLSTIQLQHQRLHRKITQRGLEAEHKKAALELALIEKRVKNNYPLDDNRISPAVRAARAKVVKALDAIIKHRYSFMQRWC